MRERVTNRDATHLKKMVYKDEARLNHHFKYIVQLSIYVYNIYLVSCLGMGPSSGTNALTSWWTPTWKWSTPARRSFSGGECREPSSQSYLETSLIYASNAILP